MRIHSGIMILALAACGPAFGADLELRDTIPQEKFHSAFSWTGFYAGVSLGSSNIEDHDGTVNLDLSGRNDPAGVFIGYTQQVGDFVIGAEYEYLNLDMQFIIDAFNLPSGIYVEDSHSVMARMGIAMDRLQVYGTAGMTKVTVDSPTVPNFPVSDWKPIVGAGVDYAVTDHVILGARYTYAWYEDFDGRPYTGNLEHYSVRLGVKF